MNTSATFTVSALKSALAKVAPAIERNSSIPILSYVHIGEGAIIGTNLDITISVNAPEAAGDGICVPFVPLYRIIRSLPGGGLVRLSPHEEGRITISFDDGRAMLNTAAASDFPLDLAKPVETEAFELPMLDLLAVSTFASRDETRYYLNGIHFDGEFMQASDGYRLTRLPFGVPSAKGILPTGAVKAMIKSFGPRAVASVQTDGMKFCAKCDGVTIFGKMIDGRFPDVKRAIPDPEKAEAIWTVGAADLASRVACITSLSGRHTRGVALIADKVGRIEGHCRSFDVGDMMILLPGKTTAPFTVGFDEVYLREVLQFHAGAEVTIRVISPGDPVTLQSNGRLTVLMPMRLNFTPAMAAPEREAA